MYIVSAELKKKEHIFYLINFLSLKRNICLGTQKNHLIEMVLLHTHNIYFDYRIRK